MSHTRRKTPQLVESLRFQKDLLMLMKQGQPAAAAEPSRTPERLLDALVRAAGPASPRRA